MSKIIKIKMSKTNSYLLRVPKGFLMIDGDNDIFLRRIGISGKIIYTPGHTIDSMCVVLDNGVVLCGDAAMSWPLWAGIRYCAIFVTDIDKYYESWKKIIANKGQVVYPSHGLKVFKA
ncbi:MAG: MBL fold metallo-hydrolase [Bacillota bacterium]